MTNSSKSLFMVFVMLASSALGAWAESMWTPQEMSELEEGELDGVIMLRFKDAVSGESIPKVTVTLQGLAPQLTDARGIARFPADELSSIGDSILALSATAPGFLALKDSVMIADGSILSTAKRFLMSKIIDPRDARIILEWDRTPSDLDAHLLGPGFHVSYRDAKAMAGKARLDRDATSGYGPETITITGIIPDAEYTYYVQNYSGGSPMKKVKVSVYINGELNRIVVIPEAKDRMVTIFKIANGAIQYLR
ncbi:MAG: hypothetical protein WCQ50_18375 [Spirochaetota bacterium]